MTTFQPLRITATLRHGIAHASPWTVALDGLLASQLWAQHKRSQPPGPAALDAANPPDLALGSHERMAQPRH